MLVPSSILTWNSTTKDTRPFPRLNSVDAWDELAPNKQKEAARDMEIYAAMIDYLDEQILRLFDYLKETGEYDNTMIIFISDNGANGGSPAAYPGQTDEYLNSFDNSLENRGLPNSFVDPGPGWAQASMAPSRLFKGVTAEGGNQGSDAGEAARKNGKRGHNESLVLSYAGYHANTSRCGECKPQRRDQRSQGYPLTGRFST